MTEAQAIPQDIVCPTLATPPSGGDILGRNEEEKHASHEPESPTLSSSSNDGEGSSQCYQRQARRPQQGATATPVAADLRIPVDPVRGSPSDKPRGYREVSFVHHPVVKSSPADAENEAKDEHDFPSPGTASTRSTSDSTNRSGETFDNQNSDNSCGDSGGAASTCSHNAAAHESKANEQSVFETPGCWRSRLQPELYRRPEEEAKLLERFHAIRSQPSAELILISGPSGSGKTRLAKTLRGAVMDMGGYFLTGKYDQLRRPTPYSAFVSAFSLFVRMVKDRGVDEVARVRDAINDAVGAEAVHVLTRMIPTLGDIMGRSRELDADTSSSDAIQRFVFVFRKFLCAVASPECPMVLLLDDIHWSDPCSIELMIGIAADIEHEGLVVIGTCDDDDEACVSDSFLSSKLRDLEDKGSAVITHIDVKNLDEHTVRYKLSETLGLDAVHSESLTEIVMQQSGGNPVLIVEFLRWLQDSELLYIDHSTGSWKWDAQDIEMTIDNRQVGDYLVDEIEQLPRNVQDVLKVAACLGPHLDEELLQYVLGVSVKSALDQAARIGIIINDESEGGYMFEHDKAQAAAYCLIDESDREMFHLEVGRRIWRHLNSDEELDRNLFTLLSQLNIGKRMIIREKEQVAVATLCLHAGTKAARSSAFRTALFYLELGISLLGQRSWRDNYELTLALYNATAEMALCRANFERMEELVDQVLRNARCLTDKTQAYASRIYALGAGEQQEEAVSTAIEVLNGFGESFPYRLSAGNLRAETKAVGKLLRGKSDEQFLRMPRMVDKDKLACMQILHLVYLSAMMKVPKLVPFIVLKMIKLTMKHGSSVFSSAAFALYGSLICLDSHRIESAYRFGKLGVKFLEQFKAPEFLPRVYATYYGFIHAWKRPLRECLEPLLHGYRIGLQTGDMEGAFICANLYCLNAAESGIPLDVIDREWYHFQEAMLSSRHKSLLSLATNKLQYIHHYMGYTDEPLSPKGDLVDFDARLKSAEAIGDDFTWVSLKSNRMLLAYVFNDLDLAEETSFDMKCLRVIPPSMKKIVFTATSGLVALACARDGRNVRKNLRVAKKVIQELDHWGTFSPHNGLDKLYLMEAEYASVTGRELEAYRKYTCALAMAKEAGFLFMCALINERIGRHYLELRDKKSALPYFKEACRYYREWGGNAKLHLLETELKKLYAPRALPRFPEFFLMPVGSDLSESMAF